MATSGTDTSARVSESGHTSALPSLIDVQGQRTIHVPLMENPPCTAVLLNERFNVIEGPVLRSVAIGPDFALIEVDIDLEHEVHHAPGQSLRFIHRLAPDNRRAWR